MKEDTTLKDLIEKAKEERFRRQDSASRDEFLEALIEAQKALVAEDIKNEEVINRLNKAIEGLVDAPVVNTDALDEAIAKANALTEEEVNKAIKKNVEVFNRALADAKAVLAKDGTYEEEIDAAEAKLNKAVDALEEKVVIEPEKPTVPEKPTEKPATKPEDKKDDTVKTGDSTMILGMVALMAVSAIVYISLKRKKFN